MTHPLYTELVLEHHQHPRHFGPALMETTHAGTGKNPNCGDAVSVHLSVREGVVKSLTWQGQGCALCMASASMLAEWVNKTYPTPEQLIARVTDVRTFLRGESDGEALGKYQTFSSVCKHPARVKCAALAWVAADDALNHLTSELTPVA